MSVSCSEKRPSGVLYLQVGSGQDLGGSKDALAKDDGGASGWEMVKTVSIEVVSIDGSVVTSVGGESVGVEGVIIEAFMVEGSVGMVACIEAIFLPSDDL